MARKIIRMANDVAGPPGSWRRRWAFLLSVGIAVVAAVVFMQTAQAVHDDCKFELDRNAIDENKACPGGGDDWDKVFNNTDTADASVFVEDGNGPTIFT